MVFGTGAVDIPFVINKKLCALMWNIWTLKCRNFLLKFVRFFKSKIFNQNEDFLFYCNFDDDLNMNRMDRSLKLNNIFMTNKS